MLKKITFILSLGFVLLGSNFVFAADDIPQTGTAPDTIPPVISLIGDNNITLPQGGVYVEEGATAVDDVDGSVAVSTIGEVNTKIAKDYIITYRSVDSNGNTSSLIRIVKVEPISSANIYLEVVTDSEVLFSGDLNVSSCEKVLGENIYTVNGYCAISQSGLESDWAWYENDAFLSSIESYSNNKGDNGVYWGWFSNLDLGNNALNKYILKEGDRIIVNYGTNPLKISVDNENPTVGDTVTVSVKEFKYDESFNPTWVPSVGSSIYIGTTVFDLDANGQYKIKILDTENIGLIAKKEGFISTKILSINPAPSKLNIFIRNGDKIIYEGIYNLPEEGVVNMIDSSRVSHEINSRSVLSIINSIDILSDNFSIPNFEYNSGLDSLYLKCLTTIDLENLCDNWQYTVGGEYPYVGMDKNILSDNPKIYIYFGPQNKIILNNNLINTKDVLTVTSQKYNYEKNIWEIRNGVTVGVTKPNPADPWNPDDSIKSLVDTNGIANFSSVPVGIYYVGVKEDYYWPTEELTVELYVSSGGGTSEPNTDSIFSILKALDFLNKNKNSDGSYGSSIYTDWVAVAAGASNNSSLKSSLSSYLKNDLMDSSVITDYERRAMALMALGINPYTGTDINYIDKIINSFDGVQFGDSSLENDDIFALVVLKNAGYSELDEIIKKDISHITSKQSSSGSWGSIDMTAAGIQALRGFENIEGVSESISKAENYLISNQKGDNGFENSFSTSWVLQSMYNNSQVLKSESYLFKKQQDDGGMEDSAENIDTRVWSTSYAIPAILHKTWDNILKDFDKPLILDIETSPNEDIKIEEILIVPAEAKPQEVEEIKLFEQKKENINTVLGKKVLLKSADNQSEIETNQKEELELITSEDSDGKNHNLVRKNVILRTFDGIWGAVKSSIIWLFIKLGF